VRAATTGNVTISTALNGGDVIDGVTLVNGDRVLVANQTNKTENGIYVAGASPARATDADSAGELSGGTLVYVEQGTKFGGRQMEISTVGSITPGTTPHEWETVTPKDFGLVEALPTSSAVAGDTCIFIASKTNGVFWQLIYDGEGEYPWKKIGGPPLAARSDTDRFLNNQTSYVSLPTDPLSITLPLKGDWDITAEVQEGITHPEESFRESRYSYSVGATPASDSWAVLMLTEVNGAGGPSAKIIFSGAKKTRHLGVPAGAVIEEKARNGGNYESQFGKRRLWVDPVRVG
jgi:hypothetical protein